MYCTKKSILVQGTYTFLCKCTHKVTNQQVLVEIIQIMLISFQIGIDLQNSLDLLIFGCLFAMFKKTNNLVYTTYTRLLVNKNDYS